jgi:hypothetical protein
MKRYFAHGDSAQREQTSTCLFDLVVHCAISCQLYTDKCMRTLPRRGRACQTSSPPERSAARPPRSTSSARLFDGITPWDGNIPETDNPPWRSSVGRATWLSRSRCFLARMIGRQGLTHVRLGQAELARNARRRDASLECSANGVQLTTSQRGLS